MKTRDSAFSLAAAPIERNVRTAPGSVVLDIENSTLPNVASRIAAAAPPAVAWAEGNSGTGGVGTPKVDVSTSHAGSAAVLGLRSWSANRIAVIGRQNL